MNLRQLNEVDGARIANFSDEFDKSVDKVASLAKGALSKFKTAKDKAEADVRGDMKASADAAEKAKKDKEVSDAKSAKEKLTIKAGPKSAPITVAGLILDRTPEEGDLPEFEDLDAEHFAYVQNATDQLQTRFEKFSKNLTKIMRTAQFINANDRKEVPERLSDQNDRILDSAETMLMQDNNGERNAWMLALTNDDPNIGAKALLAVLGKISAKHTKLNQAQAEKKYADGLNLINLIGAQRQIIEMRIALMKKALAVLSQKPVTEALLKRAGRLAKRL